MRKLFYLVLIFIAISSCSQHDSGLTPVLEAAQSRMTAHAGQAVKHLRANEYRLKHCTAAEWAKFHLLLCEAYDRTDSLQISDSALLEVISYCKKSGSKDDLRKAYCLLARVYQEANLQGAALNYYNKAVAVGTGASAGANEWTAYAFARMSDIYIGQKMYARAKTSLDTAAYLAARGNDARTNAIIAANTGAYHLSRGDLDSCIAFTRQAVAIAERAGLTQTAAGYALSLVPAYLKKDDKAAALDALNSARNIEGDKQRARYYMYCSLYHAATGNDGQAEAFYRKCAATGNFTFLRDASSEIVLSFLKSGNYTHDDKFLFPALLAQDSLNRAALSASNDLVTTLDAKMHHEQQQKQRETMLYLLIAAISALIIIGVAGAVFYVRYTRIRMKLQQEKLNNLLAQIEERNKCERSAAHTASRRDKADALMGSDIYRAFHDSRFTPQHGDYRLLEQAVNETYDNCMEHLRDIYPAIKDYEFKTCLLVKADVPLKTVAVWFGMEQNALSMLRARLYKKMFNAKKGSAVMLDDFIKSL